MADRSKDWVSAVNSVIAICKDAEQGFQGAANAVEDPNLKNMFEHYSIERQGFARELQQAVAGEGARPGDPAGAAGMAHRGWIALKGVLTGHSSHQILEETERGEDMSVERYRDALNSAPPDFVQAVLERQYEEVQRAHSRIRELRDNTAHRTA
jgi:uncharacterized protein (TIGR02284 family)